MKKIIGTLICTLFFIFLLKAQTNSRVPKSESPIESLDLSVNRVNYLHRYFPDLDGNGFFVSIKEYRFDSLDLDLLGKNIMSPSSTTRVELHATEMATILGGNGNSSKAGKGVAPAVSFSSTSFFNLGPEPLNYYLEAGISVQNHSYGLGIENFYGTEAVTYDNMVYNNPDILHVFSAGNMGEASAENGPYAEVPGFANLTGTFKMSKNVLTVGSVDAFLKPEVASSKGPAYDGRIKPELMAYGEDGTSGSAAIVSGVSVLLQQSYWQKYNQLPSVALLRSLLLNTADDLGNPGPDYTTGFGNLNAQRVLESLQNGQYWEAEIGPDTAFIYEIEVPDNIHSLKITLAWTDPPAQENQNIALIHDLDLSLNAVGQDSIWLPWILDNRPSLSALQKPAQRGIDQLNNQEQISLETPKAGTYQVRVKSNDLTKPLQSFALTYQLDTLDKLNFTYPAKEEGIAANQQQIIRWDYSGVETKGQLWYRMLPSETWLLLSDTVNLAQEWHTWNIPLVFGQAQLRMDFAEKMILSDTFLISPIPELDLVFDCGERLLLGWNNIVGAESYQLYELVGDRMEATVIVQDTFYEVNTTENETRAYSVAPKTDTQQIGLRSLALQPDAQNQVCYISNFSGSLLIETAFIDIELSTLSKVSGIELLKWDGENFQLIENFSPDQLQFFYRDEQLQKGNNFYQLIIRLEGTNTIIQSTINIFFVPLDEVLIYPNPILSGQLMEISLPTFIGRRIQVYDAMGRLVLDYDFLSEFDVLETQNWAAGVYFYQIVNEVGKREHQGKLVVR